MVYIPPPTGPQTSEITFDDPKEQIAKRSIFAMNAGEIDDIMLGIGTGMSTSDSAFVRAFGAAMAATTEARSRKREKAESRSERMAELAAIEERQMKAEERMEARRISAQKMESAERVSMLQKQFDLKKQERKDIYSEEEEQRKRAMDIRGGVNVLDEGRAKNRQSAKIGISSGLGMDFLRVGGNPPSSWSDDDLFNDIIREQGGY